MNPFKSIKQHFRQKAAAKKAAQDAAAAVAQAAALEKAAQDKQREEVASRVQRLVIDIRNMNLGTKSLEELTALKTQLDTNDDIQIYLNVPEPERLKELEKKKHGIFSGFDAATDRLEILDLSTQWLDEVERRITFVNTARIPVGYAMQFLIQQQENNAPVVIPKKDTAPSIIFGPN